MAYIPKEHEKYDILPNARKGNWEVFEYDGRLLDELQDMGIEVPFPYCPRSYEEYYARIDELIKKHPEVGKLREYKKRLIIMNDKSKWGIVRYIGETNTSFTKGRCYYVPIYEMEGSTIVAGVIDDEEFTAYEGWHFGKVETVDAGDGFIIQEKLEFKVPHFEIVHDPQGILSASEKQRTDDDER